MHSPDEGIPHFANWFSYLVAVEQNTLITLALALLLLGWNVRTDPGKFRWQKIVHGITMLLLVYLFSKNLSYLLVVIALIKGVSWGDYFTMQNKTGVSATWVILNSCLSLVFAVLLVYMMSRNNTGRKVFLLLAPAFFAVRLLGGFIGYAHLLTWEWICYPIFAILLPLLYQHRSMREFFGEEPEPETDRPIDLD